MPFLPAASRYRPKAVGSLLLVGRGQKKHSELGQEPFRLLDRIDANTIVDYCFRLGIQLLEILKKSFLIF